MKAVKIIISLILKIISIPFMLIGLFGLCIFALSNIILADKSEDMNEYAIKPYKGLLKL